MPLQDKLSKLAKNRLPSAIQFNPIEDMCEKYKCKPEDFVQMNHGDPNERLFPWDNVTMRLIDGQECNLNLQELAEVLQYLPTVGYTPLVKALKHLTKRFHSAPGSIVERENEWELILSCGAMDGVSKSFDLFLDEGDSYLLEVPCYSNILAALRPYNGRPICCEVDADGLIPSQIRARIEECKKKGWPTPKFLYTCPTATNPAGLCTSGERRREIYKMACEYDFYIIEDDPYFFVRFDDDAFKDIPSYLALDTEGRVIRIDSFSKSLSSGIRVGWVVARNDIIHKLILHTETTQMHCSGMGQAMVAKLFEVWGEDKFLEHTKRVAQFYKRQMETMCQIVDKHLGGLVEYKKPNGGLFLWIKVPSIPDTKALIANCIAKKKVITVFGTAFQPDFGEQGQLAEGGFKHYIRCAYSQVTPDRMEHAFKLLREAIDEEIETLKVAPQAASNPVSMNTSA